MRWWCGAGLRRTASRALVALAKKSPGALTYGSTGNGSASHLAAELFKLKAGVDLLHVPFRGAAPMTTELLAGRIDVTFVTLPSVISYIDAGVLRALAVASPKRAPRLPNVPTLAEAGIAGVEADAWFALFAPAKTPPDALDKSISAVSAALSAKTASERHRRAGHDAGAAAARRGGGMAAGRGDEMGGGDQGGRRCGRVAATDTARGSGRMRRREFITLSAAQSAVPLVLPARATARAQSGWSAC